MNSLLGPFLYQPKHFPIISPLMVQMIQLISVISQNMFFLIFHINYVQTSLWYFNVLNVYPSGSFEFAFTHIVSFYVKNGLHFA